MKRFRRADECVHGMEMTHDKFCRKMAASIETWSKKLIRHVAIEQYKNIIRNEYLWCVIFS